jgi:hypothetical protein
MTGIVPPAMSAASNAADASLRLDIWRNPSHADDPVKVVV